MRLSKYLNIIGFITIVVFAFYTCTNSTIIEPIKATTSKSDSLQNVIDSLQVELEQQAEGFDNKERRYEDVLFEYELGISYLKDYHPKAYQDFHRIIGMKERYSNELERENKKRLQLEKFDYE